MQSFKQNKKVSPPLIYRRNVNQAFINALVKAFPASGYDPVNNTLNGKPLGRGSDQENPGYLLDSRTIVTSILGLPNRKLNGRKEFTWSDIGLNFIGWERNVSTPKKIFNVFFGVFPLPIVLTYNVVKTAVTLVRNVVAIFTEFLPKFLSNLTQSAIQNLANQDVNPDWNDSLTSSKKQSSPGLIALKGLKKALDGWNFIGMAITSPANNIRKGWKEAKEAWKTNTDTEKKRDVLGAAWAVTKMVLSGLITVAAIAVTFKFAVPYIAVHAPVWFAGVHAPAWLAGPFKAVTSFLSPVTTPISNFVSGAVNTLVNTLGVTGTSFAAAAVVPPVMVGLGRANHAMTNKWREPVESKGEVKLLPDHEEQSVPESTAEYKLTLSDANAKKSKEERPTQMPSYDYNSLKNAPQEVQDFWADRGKDTVYLSNPSELLSNNPNQEKVLSNNPTVQTMFNTGNQGLHSSTKKVEEPKQGSVPTLGGKKDNSQV